MKRAAGWVLGTLAGLARGLVRAVRQDRFQRQDLRNAALVALRDGATHARHFGPAVAFYRQRDGRIESCFVEYNTSSGLYDWIGEPAAWREASGGIPSEARPITEIVR